MTSVLLFLFMFLTCLMFLGMLWGDRLSFPGLFEGNWLNPISGLINLVSRTLGRIPRCIGEIHRRPSVVGCRGRFRNCRVDSCRVPDGRRIGD